ncbi:MAG: sugar transferase [Clostridia bacterium]|nr:sugar transferase [Clostridia bacterium]
MYAKYVKRILDFTLSLLAFIVLSPTMLILAICIKIDSKGPIFFLQERLGRNGKVFKIIKFRTMIVNAEQTGLKLKGENDNRITKFGNVLRKTSLDELPQLINVIKGEMALIGPRPPVTYHPHKFADYPEHQKLRFYVRPGITGLAQVRVRNNATWDERIEIDLEYIEKITFAEDFKILIDTVVKTIKKENIYKKPEPAQNESTINEAEIKEKVNAGR